jgi:hypothetical protein
VNAPITGPLSTNQYPSTIPYHNYGTLTGQRPTPPQFFPSQEPIYAEMNTNARKQYLRATSISSVEKAKQDFLGKLSPVITNVNYSTQRQIPVSTHVNYIAPIQSSMYLTQKKAMTVGKATTKYGLPASAPYTTKNVDKSYVRSSVRRARSGGSVAPKKKGALENKYLCNAKTCGGIGTNFANQTY